ncbi:hypothetical protein [Streptomyces canus]|uniref:hypothetical protein n=1 Tax=Streptomyces canus TaxID=58343 RepID=UPI003CE762D9
MSADGETGHDMKHQDIALLLAEAADGVEIGTAPAQALLRGGRRRRARRRAVATAAALVVVGVTGALAAGGLPGGDGGRVAPAATQSPTASPTLFQPHGRTTLATGTDGGKEWRVTIDVWPAPVDAQEAQAMMDAMAEYGETPTAVRTAAELVGRSAYFVHRGTEENGVGWEHLTLSSMTTRDDHMAGKDIDAFAVPLDPGSLGPDRLVIGHVAKTARQVTCTWEDGTTSVVRKAPADTETATDDPAIRPAEGSPYNWFVCLAPQGTEYRSAEVTG